MCLGFGQTIRRWTKKQVTRRNRPPAPCHACSGSARTRLSTRPFFRLRCMTTTCHAHDSGLPAENRVNSRHTFQPGRSRSFAHNDCYSSQPSGQNEGISGKFCTCTDDELVATVTGTKSWNQDVGVRGSARLGMFKKGHETTERAACFGRHTANSAHLEQQHMEIILPRLQSPSRWQASGFYSPAKRKRASKYASLRGCLPRYDRQQRGGDMKQPRTREAPAARPAEARTHARNRTLRLLLLRVPGKWHQTHLIQRQEVGKAAAEVHAALNLAHFAVRHAARIWRDPHRLTREISSIHVVLLHWLIFVRQGGQGVYFQRSCGGYPAGILPPCRVFLYLP